MAATSLSGIGLSISEAFARVNPREKKLLLFLSLIVLALAPLKTFDMRQKAAEANGQAQALLTKAKLDTRRATGAGLNAQIEATRHEVRGWSWPASTIAVGQVMVQDKMSELATAGGLAGAEVKVLGHPQAAGPVTLAAIEIVAPFSWPGLSGFLSGLTATDQGFVLDSVTMTDDKEPKVKIDLRLPLIIQEVP